MVELPLTVSVRTPVMIPFNIPLNTVVVPTPGMTTLESGEVTPSSNDSTVTTKVSCVNTDDLVNAVVNDTDLHVISHEPGFFEAGENVVSDLWFSS